MNGSPSDNSDGAVCSAVFTASTDSGGVGHFLLRRALAVESTPLLVSNHVGRAVNHINNCLVSAVEGEVVGDVAEEP